MISGYWQIPLKKSDQWKTAFKYNGKQYLFRGMPFGLTNAPAIFQRTMEEIFQEEIAKGIMVVYMDDICVFSRGWKEHLEHLRSIFKKARALNLKLNKNKCSLGKEL